jgi:hypothetical protein
VFDICRSFAYMSPAMDNHRYEPVVREETVALNLCATALDKQTKPIILLTIYQEREPTSYA